MRIRCRFPIPAIVVAIISSAGSASAQTPDQPVASPAVPPGAAAPLSTVARRIAGFQGDYERLHSQIDAETSRDEALRNQRRTALATMTAWTDQINGRLAAGTTRGNPDLVAQWRQAKLAFDALDRSSADLSALSADVAGTVALAGYLGNAIKAAYALQGATDADHASLIALQQSAAESARSIDRLARQVNREIDDHSTTLDTAHRRLTALRHAIDIGLPLSGNLAAAEPMQAR